MSEMKLYVWEGFCPDCTDGLAFAIAKNEFDARKLILKNHGHKLSDWGDLTVHKLDGETGIAYEVCGGG